MLKTYVPNGKKLAEIISDKGWNLHEHHQEIHPGMIDVAKINPLSEKTPSIKKNYLLLQELKDGQSIPDAMETDFRYCPALVFSDFRIFRFTEIFFDSQYLRLHGVKRHRMSIPYMNDNHIDIFYKHFRIHESR